MTFVRRRPDGVTVREVEGDLLILDLDAGQIHKLNQTASHIWRHLDAAPAPEQLARILGEAFEVEEEVALMDVLETLRRFRELNLITEA
jgi:Coenzyme PQQ synthesis protein D (PqqD)